MKILPLSLKSSLESSEYVQSLLINIDVYGNEFRFTTWAQKLYYNSILYLPRSISVKGINYGAAAIVETISLEIDDVDRAMYAAFAEQDAGDFPLSITFVILDSEYKILADLVLFTGNVSQWEYIPGKFSLRASSIFEQWSRETPDYFSGSCRWRIFKGVECKYVGNGSFCDRTFSQCLAYGNTYNFGGFRWLASMVNKKIGI